MDISNQIMAGSRGFNNDPYPTAQGVGIGRSTTPVNPIQQVNAEIDYHRGKVQDLLELKEALEENPGIDRVLSALSKLNR